MKKRLIGFALLLAMACYWTCTNTKPTPTTPGGEAYLHFPTPLSPATPYDVDTKLQQELTNKKEFAAVDRLFDILAWQQFVALNWPTGPDGKPMPKPSDPGLPVWENWEESFEVFQSDGGAPTAALDVPDHATGQVTANNKAKILFRTNKSSDFHSRKNIDFADEIDQAFTSPIWDQNGNIVRYEIRLNKKTVDYIVGNQLNNYDGQIEFSKKGGKVTFPSGSRNEEGTIELKVAWRILTADDAVERYIHTEAMVLNEDGKTYSKKQVGLIGMHIASKTVSSPQWIWATFEHVDNLQTNPLDKVNGKSIQPSFYNPDCPTCPVNLFPDTTKKPVKNQIQRVMPIAQSTQALNTEVQTLLADAKSPLQYYQLIGTQWPTNPSAKPYQPDTIKGVVTYKLPDAISNKSGGEPTPVYLTNMVMETYFQGQGDNTPTGYNAISLGNEPAYLQIEGFPKTQTAKIFGTESCVGCHSSASIAVGDTVENGVRKPVFGAPLGADFDWLMQLKASFKKQ